MIEKRSLTTRFDVNKDYQLLYITSTKNSKPTWLYTERIATSKLFKDLLVSINMDSELKNKIIEDIKATGFPSELSVANTLKSLKWDIEQNGTYLDYEMNKSREIDISARKVFSYEGDDISFYFAINLIVEVKKSSKRPWVFFTIPNKKNRGSHFIGPAYSQLRYFSNFDVKNLSPSSLMKEFPRNKQDSIGTSFYEAFKAPDESSKIYEAIMSSIKAAFYEHRLESGEEYLTEEEIQEIENRPFNPKAQQSLDIYMPVIVLDGILCEATLLDNHNIELVQKNYVPVTISHSIKPYNNHYDYYPEIIHIDYVSHFLNDIEKWGNSIKSLWKKE